MSEAERDLRGGDAAAAKQSLSSALAINPNDPAAKHLLGLATWAEARQHSSKDRLQTAERLLLDASRNCPAGADCYDWALDVVAFYIDLADLSSAETQLKSIGRPKMMPERYLTLYAELRILQHQWNEAEQLSGEAIAINPEYCPGLETHAEALLLEGKTQLARNEFDAEALKCEK